jgi:tRNA modification GTPase
VLRVLNKSDLGIHGGWSTAADAVPISCLNNTGIAALEDAMQLAATGGADRGNWSVAINARHQECLEKAKAAMNAAQKAFADGLSPEFVAEDLRASMNAVGDVVGRPDTEELLGVIFSSFCIGK